MFAAHEHTRSQTTDALARRPPPSCLGAASAGMDATAHCGGVGVTQGAVSHWLTGPPRMGSPPCRTTPPPGPTPLLTADHRAHRVGLLEQGAAACGFRGAGWTCRRVVRLIREQVRVSDHPAHVRRLRKQLDWTPHRPSVHATQRDEAAIAVWYAARWPARKPRQCGKAARSSGSPKLAAPYGLGACAATPRVAQRPGCRCHGCRISSRCLAG